MSGWYKMVISYTPSNWRDPPQRHDPFYSHGVIVLLLQIKMLMLNKVSTNQMPSSEHDIMIIMNNHIIHYLMLFTVILILWRLGPGDLWFNNKKNNVCVCAPNSIATLIMLYITLNNSISLSIPEYLEKLLTGMTLFLTRLVSLCS